MPHNASYTLPVAQAKCEHKSREHIWSAWRDLGFDPEVTMAGLKAHHSFLPFPSSYRLLLQIEWHRGAERHMHNDYFLLIEQANREYRIDDLQVQPEV